MREQAALTYQVNRNVSLSLSYVHEHYFGAPNTLISNYGRDAVVASITAHY
jgi:hypothetical protein